MDYNNSAKLSTLAKTLTGKGLISMKHTAVLCSIGQIGKNCLPCEIRSVTGR